MDKEWMKVDVEIQTVSPEVMEKVLEKIEEMFKTMEGTWFDWDLEWKDSL